jgi:hypothetical protein
MTERECSAYLVPQHAGVHLNKAAGDSAYGVTCSVTLIPALHPSP